MSEELNIFGLPVGEKPHIQCESMALDGSRCQNEATVGIPILSVDSRGDTHFNGFAWSCAEHEYRILHPYPTGRFPGESPYVDYSYRLRRYAETTR